MKKLLCFALLCLFISCEKQSDLIHIVELQDIDPAKQYVSSYEVVRLRVIAQSNSSSIESIKLTEFDVLYGDRVVIDTVFVPSEKKVDFYFNYTIPFVSDTTRMRFTSQVFTVEGDTRTYLFDLYVLSGEQKVEAVDDITLYSASSGKKSGYNLLSKNTVFYETSLTDTLVFFDKKQADTTRLDQLSREWWSDSGVFFARFSSFNFGEATAASIQNAFENSVKDNIIQNIVYDDIILVGTKDTAYGVLKVILVVDEDGTEDDRYVFSAKMIKDL